MEDTKHYQSQERKGIAEGSEWTDQDLAVKADTPLVDAGTGKKMIIRLFDFKFDPSKKDAIKIAKLNKQGFFNSHAKYIKDFLWKDGLRVVDNQDPKLIFKGNGYRIAVVCQASSGVFIDQKGQTLQDIFKKKKK